MQYLVKVTHNGKVVRIPSAVKAAAEKLQKLLKDAGHQVDQRIYEHNGNLHREADEVNVSARILRAIVK